MDISSVKCDINKCVSGVYEKGEEFQGLLHLSVENNNSYEKSIYANKM